MARIEEHPRYAEICEQIDAGMPSTHIAEWLQDQGYFPDNKPDSLARKIRRIARRRRTERPAAEVIPPERRATIEKNVERLEQGVNALEEMAMTIRIQHDRVRRFNRLESELGVPLPNLGGEIERLAQMAARYIQTMQSLGLEPKVPDALLLGVSNVRHGVIGETGISERLDQQAIVALLDIERGVSGVD